MLTTELQGKQYTINAKDGGVLELVPVKPEVRGLWKPAKGERFFFIPGLSERGFESTNYTSRMDENAINNGNCWPSEEAVKKAIPLMARANKIIAAALQADPDAGEFQSRYYSAFFCNQRSKWIGERFSNNATLPAYVHSPEQADEMARILNEEGVK